MNYTRYCTQQKPIREEWYSPDNNEGKPYNQVMQPDTSFMTLTDFEKENSIHH